MRWEFAIEDLKGETTLQDQIFTPEHVAILFVLYAVHEMAEDGRIPQRSPLTIQQVQLIESLIFLGRVPSRRQFNEALDSSGTHGDQLRRRGYNPN